MKREKQRQIECAANAEKKRLREEQLMIWVATKLQAAWRGKNDKNKVKGMLRAQRLEKRGRWLQRKADDEVRKDPWFQLRDALGVAEELESDTAEERAKRKMAVWSDKDTAVGRAVHQIGKVVGDEIGDEIVGVTCDCQMGSRVVKVSADLRKKLKRGDRIRVGLVELVVEPKPTEEEIEELRRERVKRLAQGKPMDGDSDDDDEDTKDEGGDGKEKPLYKLKPFDEKRLPIDRSWPMDTDKSKGLPIFKLKKLEGNALVVDQLKKQ